MLLLLAGLLGNGCTPAPRYTGHRPAPGRPAVSPPVAAPRGTLGLILDHPLRGLSRQRIGSPFGIRRHPSYGTSEFHQGVDFQARMGEDVFAAAGGNVGFSGRRRRYGTVVIIEHGGDVHTVYAHLSEAGVQKGDSVETGQWIGRVGVSGNATGAHLHFELRIGGEAVDPLGYMSLGR
ncbi:MAG: M23 family metallopeptidase [Candidatus Krumholzibacteria bacterium]|nr:M23 family metallopeptidase [Candidatus Krumholzibacteria bacterium]